MKKHVWRPVYVVIGLVAVILLGRSFYVPDDFGSQDRGYTFGFHRLSNEQEWKEYPEKYQGKTYCGGCHDALAETFNEAQHGMLQCENCHGAAFDHPEEPAKLAIDRSRALCLRCHADLYMPSSGRMAIPGINPAEHNADMECSDCHNPHNPSLEEM